VRPVLLGGKFAPFKESRMMFRRVLEEARSFANELLRNQAHIRRRVNALAVMEKERYLRDLLSNPKYDDVRRLERYGFKVYSQYDEDGFIQEIFKRIGVDTKIFVEFGVGDGLENNTLKLLLEGWQGLWLESSERFAAKISAKFGDVISAGRLRVKCAFVDRDNIDELIGDCFTGNIDLLSIDIDGNDIYILDAITAVRPRAIVIEYNGKFPPPISIAQRYNSSHRWSGTDYCGASLEAVTKVAGRKGYSLVGCGIVGVNAFLVRNDLVGDNFQVPFTAENHYQPARYFLWNTFHSGHPADWGAYEII
jgi:hypothetical protein